MDRVFAAAERQRRLTHGIARAAALDEVGHPWLVALDLPRGRPVRPAIFPGDEGGTGPALAGPADADRVAHGAAVAEHVIKAPFVALDDDRAGRAFLEAHVSAPACRLGGEPRPDQDGK